MQFHQVKVKGNRVCNIPRYLKENEDDFKRYDIKHPLTKLLKAVWLRIHMNVTWTVAEMPMDFIQVHRCFIK